MRIVVKKMKIPRIYHKKLKAHIKNDGKRHLILYIVESFLYGT